MGQKTGDFVQFGHAVGGRKMVVTRVRLSVTCTKNVSSAVEGAWTGRDVETDWIVLIGPCTGIRLLT